MGHFEGFAKNVEHAVASNKSDQDDVPIRDILKCWDLCIWTERSNRNRALFNYLDRCLAFQTTVPVVPVMEALEVLALPFKLGIAVKPLPPEKLFIVGIVEAFDHSIAPRLRHRNKHGLDTEMQAKTNNQTR